MIQKFISQVKESNHQFSDPILQCLYLIKHDKWDEAHDIAQDIESDFGYLLHGFLHKIEGDVWNAKYWYRRANEEYKEVGIESEWYSLVEKYLKS